MTAFFVRLHFDRFRGIEKAYANTVGVRSRMNTQLLIAAIQQRSPPGERMPPRPERLEADKGTSEIRSIDDYDPLVPPDWERPDPPHWLRDLKFGGPTIIRVEPNDEITLETGDTAGDTLAVAPGSRDRDSPGQNRRGATLPFDASAYYLPFHYYRSDWGVYLLASGILDLVGELIRHRLRLKPERWLIGFAARALWLHELFHHRAEIACSRLELPLPAPRAGASNYSDYFHDRIGSFYEEAIANAYVARNIERYYKDIEETEEFVTARFALLDVMDHQPKPYGLWHQRVGNGPYGRGRDTLINRMFQRWLPSSPAPAAILGSALYFGHPHHEAEACPVYMVLDQTGPLIRVGKPFPKFVGLQVFVHSNDHRPPHFHVRDLDSGNETRYLWPPYPNDAGATGALLANWDGQTPPLRLYPNDPPLPGRKQEHLQEYLAKYRRQMAARVNAVYGSG